MTLDPLLPASDRVEAAVIGGGPVGATAAIALALAGVRTCLVAGPKREGDHRTSALLAGSVTALEALGAFARLADKAAPLRILRIVDATGRWIRSPEACFHAEEIGLDAFGHSVENVHLDAALRARAAEIGIDVIDEAALEVWSDPKAAQVRTASRLIETEVLAAADGRDSITRRAAGIRVEGFRYAQSALAFTVRHGRPHGDTSTEFHFESGPLTFVPLRGHRSSVVWVVDPAEATHLAALGPEELARAVEKRSDSFLGKLAVEPGVSVFPLAVQTATQLVGPRTALLGEAAHVIPPIGAQGLNLGLRDAAAIAEVLATAKRRGAALGSPEVLARYAQARQADVAARVVAVDFLNRSLLTELLPVAGARRLGLSLLQRIGPLRRAVMRQGIAPISSLPKLMRGEWVSSREQAR